MPEHQRNHTVTQAYLDLFADNGMLMCHLVDPGWVKKIPTEHATVHGDFYVYRRADGSRCTDFEVALGDVENVSVPLLRTLPQRWPLWGPDRAKVAEYVAIQMLRTPAWRAFHDPLRDAVLEDQEADFSGIPPDLWEEHVDSIRSDKHRLEVMGRQFSIAASLIASMQWTLLEFGKRRLLTSDHPVVAIGPEPGAAEAVPRWGLANVVEYRFPVTPTCALLFAWRDNGPDERRRGFPQDAQALNFSVRSQAQTQWFWHPESSLASGFDEFHLMTSRFYDYDVGVAMRSQTRARIVERLQRLIDVQSAPRDKIVTVGRPRGPIEA
jgi:hypothetical protein